MTANCTAFDNYMMTIALNMARRGLGQTAPNPSVGAVIADEAIGVVIARAVTAKGGRPHAETIAIAQAGARAKGATIYVTLEPCSHHGQTGPCADAIIAAGLKRAVVAIEDPDPRVAGRGLDKLRAAGIEVVRGVGSDEARWLTRGHIVRVTERRPFVTLKMALDANGEIARGEAGKPCWVTGDAARASGHLLRARADAFLVGAGTIRDDNPDLTCRLPGLQSRSPVRVALSRALDIPAASRILETANQVPVWLVGAHGIDDKRRAEFEAKGAQVIETNTVGDNIWLPAVMEELVARGITRLLVEGGPGMWRSFADQSLVDELVLYMEGPNTIEAQARAAIVRFTGHLDLELLEKRSLEPDTMWRLRRVLPKRGP